MANKKTVVPERKVPETHISHCTISGVAPSNQFDVDAQAMRADAVNGMSNGVIELAKALQEMAKSLKGPDKIGSIETGIRIQNGS